MRRFVDRTVRLSDLIAEYDIGSPNARKIKRLSKGVSLNSMVTVSWVRGSVRNTLYSITELPNQKETM
jgi:hypothetical protein